MILSGQGNSSTAINSPQATMCTLPRGLTRTKTSCTSTPTQDQDYALASNYSNTAIYRGSLTVGILKIFFPLCSQPHSNTAEKFDCVSKYLSCSNFSYLFGLPTEPCVNILQVMEFLKSMAGMEYVGFSNATWVLCFRKFKLIVLCHVKCNFLIPVVFLQFPVREGNWW